MYCSKCGKQIADDSRFCPACGYQVKESRGRQEDVHAPGEQYGARPQTEPNSKQPYSDLPETGQDAAGEFTITCPHCGQCLGGTDDLYGQTVDCPTCSGKIEIAVPQEMGQQRMAAPAIVKTTRNPVHTASPANIDARSAKSPASGQPALWNPNAAANWSLLFTPMFGAWIHAKNWVSLNEDQNSKKSMLWVYGGFVWLFIGLFLSDKVNQFGVFLLIAWYFAAARAQAKYIKERNIQYQRKPWGKPILIGLGAWVLIAVVVVIKAAVSGEG